LPGSWEIVFKEESGLCEMERKHDEVRKIKR